MPWTLATALCLAATAVVLFGASEGSFPVMCYFTNWAQYRVSPGTFTPAHVPPALCTHLLFAFAKINPTTLAIETTDWRDAGLYSQLVALKKDNPALKVLLALGGAGAGSSGFLEAAGSEDSRQTFARNAVRFLRANALDGLDVDWEFPAKGDRQKFTLLLAALYSEMAAEAETAGRQRLLLTAAVAAYSDTVDTIYEPEKIHRYVDYMLVMAYDYYGPWSAVLGHNSPLYATGSNRKLSQNASMSHWLAVGTPPEKLIMGLATYARSFRMNSSTENGPGDAYLQGQSGDVMPTTQTPGSMAYYEVCELLDAGFVSVWDEDSQVPHAYGPRGHHWEWVAYDDVNSMAAKSHYIVAQGLGGAMFWCLDKDDFHGVTCGQGPYPLINTVSGILSTAVRTTTTTTTTPATTTTTTRATTVSSPSPSVVETTTSAMPGAEVSTLLSVSKETTPQSRDAVSDSKTSLAFTSVSGGSTPVASTCHLVSNTATVSMMSAQTVTQSDVTPSSPRTTTTTTTTFKTASSKLAETGSAGSVHGGSWLVAAVALCVSVSCLA